FPFPWVDLALRSKPPLRGGCPTLPLLPQGTLVLRTCRYLPFTQQAHTDPEARCSSHLSPCHCTAAPSLLLSKCGRLLVAIVRLGWCAAVLRDNQSVDLVNRSLRRGFAVRLSASTASASRVWAVEGLVCEEPSDSKGLLRTASLRSGEGLVFAVVCVWESQLFVLMRRHAVRGRGGGGRNVGRAALGLV
ncbi:hypothetical protein LZ31DRAFT_625472, partial [Colletotrichum somersetense]